MSAFYRKYRPQDLSEVVGQRHVVRTLEHAIASGRVRHAYLFAGPRGTAKTSLARILAKSLNCLEADGPTTTPCKRCASCVSIHNSSSLDVIELDAASNRGIENVREIRERVAVRPVQGRRKVYILDEAHSLTTDASNALLKTLEEPPEHVVFVLCTTEPHRLLDTIKGRCQAFAFTRPTLDELGTVLRRIAAAESIEVDDAALDLIARAGRGSFRDAVSVLDQLATACDRQIGLDDARALLGVVDAATLVRLTDLVAARDAAGLLVAVDELVEGGQDLGQLLSDLTEHVRNVFLTRQLGQPPRSAPITADARADLARQAEVFDERTLMAFADGLVAVQSDLREGGDPRLPLELLLVKLTRPAAERSVDALLRRVDALESGAPHAAPAAPPAQPVMAAPPAAPPVAAAPPPPVEAPPLAPDHVAQAPVAEPPAPAADPPPAAFEPMPPVPPAAQHEPIEVDPTAVVAAQPPEPIVAESPAAPPAPPPAAPLVPPAPVVAREPADEHDLRRIWDDEVLPRLEEERPSLAATFRSAWPLALEGDVLRIAFPSTEQFAKSRADTDANRALLAGVMATAFGERLRPRLETVDVQPEPVGAPTAAAAEAADPVANEQAWEDGLRETFGATEEFEE